MGNDPVNGVDEDGGFNGYVREADGSLRQVNNEGGDYHHTIYNPDGTIEMQILPTLFVQGPPGDKFANNVAAGMAKGYDNLINYGFGWIPGFGQAFARTYNAFNDVAEGDYLNAAFSLGLGKVGKVSKSLGAGHHPIPKVFGGNVKQILTNLPDGLHKQLHSNITKAIKAATGFPDRGPNGSRQIWANLMKNNKGLQRQVFKVVLNVSHQFDRLNGTSIWQDVKRSIKNGDFTPYK